MLMTPAALKLLAEAHAAARPTRRELDGVAPGTRSGAGMEAASGCGNVMTAVLFAEALAQCLQGCCMCMEVCCTSIDWGAICGAAAGAGACTC